MLSTELAKLLAPFRHVTGRSAMLPLYKAIELAPDHVAACSSFAILDVACEIGISQTVYVDGAAFMAVLHSLPEGKEFKLVSQDNQLSWSCGAAKGRLASMAITNMPAIKLPTSGNQTSLELAKALELGSLSCDDNSSASVGINGLSIRDGCRIGSTDNTTVSNYTLSKPLKMPPEVTLPLPAVTLLAAIIDDHGLLSVDGDHVRYSSDFAACEVKQVKAVKARIDEVMQRFGEANTTAAIPERVGAFIKQANALAENRRNARVLLSAGDNRISLRFVESTAETGEYFLAEELPGFPTLAPVSLSGVKLARALAHVDEIVLDYLDAAVIVLRGGNFSYLISGQLA